ncbi:beta-1,6-N-acetylglucosaminyltransferase [Capnocytophaga stomatis]|uniref:Peptide O-xylosyltransferase n=1 Tax=Capnocytophaga stomatis TaxID=1848904 RepID=A0ABW8QBE4_9FLAO|nr:beta-1,6-N-acetylglucosaminyltransferase [Capnocytophaga stomatis]GIJ93628.1 glycosyl transferase [Capnocytophaga stomatis]
MQKNYIILAHRNPKQLARMIDKLDDGQAYFYIHLDLRVKIDDFQKEISKPNVFFIPKREECFWGDFSIVKATLNLMEAVRNDNRKGFVILMSGQDYPIKNQMEIDEFLSYNEDFNFIEITPIEEKWKKKMAKDKVFHYHILHSSKRSDSNSYAPFFHTDIKQKIRILIHFLKGRLSFKNLKKLLQLPERKPIFPKQYAGSQWWAFNEQTFQKLFFYLQENKEDLENYYRFTSSPDEIFFHSVLMHLQESDAEIKIKPSVTYVNWDRKGCQLPVLFQSSDLQELEQQKDKLFARKFDVEIDSEIFNLLDETNG